MDVLTLPRVQFALTILFHYLFPLLSIGLGVLMALGKGRPFGLARYALQNRLSQRKTLEYTNWTVDTAVLRRMTKIGCRAGQLDFPP